MLMLRATRCTCRCGTEFLSGWSFIWGAKQTCSIIRVTV